jgi:GGDEF domain-containing protein
MVPLLEELRSAGVEMKECLLVQLLLTLIQQSRLDALTGLYNRRALMEYLAREVHGHNAMGPRFLSSCSISITLSALTIPMAIS